MAPRVCRFWPTHHRSIYVSKWRFLRMKMVFWSEDYYMCLLYSMKPNKKTQFWLIGSAQFDVHNFSKRKFLHRRQMTLPKQRKSHTPTYKNLPNLTFYFFYLTNLPRQLEPHLVATGNYGSGSYFPYVLTNLGQWPLAWYSGQLLPNVEGPMVASSNQVRLLFWAICLSTPIAQASSRQPKSRATFWPFIKPGLVWISVGRWCFSRWFRR